MPSVNPYLTFDGNCEEAFNFYRSVFKVEIPYMGRFGEMPQGDDSMKVPDEEANRVMHVSLQVGDTVIMGSDKSSAHGPAHNIGNNITINLNTDSKEQADEYYNGLAEGGQPSMPMNETFWGSYFGMLTDKFGIQWMVSYDTGDAQQ